MIKVILAAFLIASCTSKPVFPTRNADETKWEQQYRDGEITWAEYQDKLKSEKKLKIDFWP